MKTNIFARNTYLIIISILFICLCSSHAFSADQQTIKARYKKPRGNTIKWYIHIPSPAPAAVIVTQHIPPGTTVKSSKPAYQSFDPETGTVKWLLTDVRPGNISMKMELDRPISKKGEIKGDITFQDKTSKPIAYSSIAEIKKKALEGC